MLETRVLTAAVLVPLFVLGVFYLPGPYFSLLLGVFVVLGALEWTILSGYGATRSKMTAVAVAAVSMAMAYRFRDAIEPVLAISCLIWLAVAMALFFHRRHALMIWPPTARWISGVWVLVPAWLAVTVLQESNPGAALLLLLLVWAADTGAYFAGRRWGRRKLAPAISPGKTVEGLWGGVAAAVAVAALFGGLWRLDTADWAALVCWSIVVILLSVCGDLFESNWKRLANVKDSGEILPGHGGVLDRIDSMTAAAPFFTLGWLWWFGSSAA